MILSEKQRRFVDEYLIDLNASAAAIRAGYKHGEIGRRLITKSHVQEAIQAGRLAQQERTQITADRVVEEYALIAFSSLDQMLDFSGPTPRLIEASRIPKSARRAIASIRLKRQIEGENNLSVEVVEFKLWDKIAALGQLARHCGVCEPKSKSLSVDVTTGGKPIEQPRDFAVTVGQYAAAISAILESSCARISPSDDSGKPLDTGGSPGQAEHEAGGVPGV